MNWHIVVADAAAVCGVAFGLYTLLAKRRDSKRDVKVTLTERLTDSAQPSYVLVLHAANAGRRPVTLTSPEIALPGGRRLALPRPVSTAGIPCTLAESADCTVIVGAQEIASAFAQLRLSGTVRLVGQFTDTLGRVHRSKRRKVRTDTVYRAASNVSA
jgi:hypothetical protein